jgi:hypothetical protein
MARLLGDAFVGVKATGERQFVMDTKRMADVASKAAKVMVKADLDPRGAQTGLDRLKIQADGLIKTLRKMPADVDDKMARAGLLSMQVQADKLVASLADMPVDADIRQAEVKFLRLEARYDRMRAKLSKNIPVDVDVKKGVLSRLGGLFGGGGGAAGGGGLPILPVPPPVAIGAIVAGLAALPFAAQVAAGGIVTALGGGLATMAIIGASKSKAVQKSFGDLKDHASADLTKIGTSFVPVMQSIADTATKTFDGLTPTFANAAKTLSKPFQDFVDALIKAFGQPAMQQAIQAVAKAFGDILKALTPSLPGMIKGIADGVKSIAHAVSDNPQAFADFIKFLFAAAEGALKAIGWLTKVATYLEEHFVPAFDRARHEIAHIWDVMFDTLIGSQIRFGHNVEHAWDTLMTDIKLAFDIAKNKIGIIWDDIELIFLRGVQFILTIMGKLPGPLGKPFRDAKVDIGNSMAAIQADVRRRTGQIQADFDALHGKTVEIHMNGQGLYTITGSIISQSHGGGSGNAAGGLAAGGFISGGIPGRDSVMAALMPGEVVVPTKMVAAGAVDHLRGYLPGFAAGGVVTGHTSDLTPGFVSGMYGTFQNRMTAAMVTAMRAGIKVAEAAARAAAASFGVSNAGPVGGDAAANLRLARSMFPWSADQWPAFNTLEMHEAGYNRFARNPSSGAYGIPQALPPTKMPFAAQAAGGSHAGPQLSWMYSYIRGRYGTPAAAWGQYYAHPGGVGYYASGGVVGLQARLATQQAAEGRDYTGLRHAFFGGPHKYLTTASVAALYQLHLAQGREQVAYKKLLSGPNVSDANLAILRATAAAEQATLGRAPVLSRRPGGHPGWTSGLSYWLGQLSGTAGGGLSPWLPGITHSYGGDVGNVVAEYLASVLSPLGMARGGRVKSFDNGGLLMPGTTLAVNNTGRPEPVGQAGTVNITLNVYAPVGSQADLENWLLQAARKVVMVKGGGDAQVALGASYIRNVRR